MAAQPEVEKKGFVSSVLGLVDDTFTRVTAGVSAGEVRRMLRGEPPGRPNPRLKPHTESFLLHIKPTYYHESVTRFTHTFRLGLLSTYLFFFETITGLILMIWYTPSPEPGLRRHDPAAEQRALRPVHARPAPPRRRIDGADRHLPHGAHLSHRQLQGAAPVHLVYRRHSACRHAFLSASLAIFCRGTSWHTGLLQSARQWPKPCLPRSSAKPSTCWPAARPTLAPMASCASTCCMCSSCR